MSRPFSTPIDFWYHGGRTDAILEHGSSYSDDKEEAGLTQPSFLTSAPLTPTFEVFSKVWKSERTRDEAFVIVLVKLEGEGKMKGAKCTLRKRT